MIELEAHTMSDIRYRFIFIILLQFISFSCFSLTDKYRCMWREDPSTTMVIGWNQVSGAFPTLYYDENNCGLESNSYRFSQKPDRVILAKGMNNHFVRLTGLKPNTTYHFIIVDSEHCSERMSFQTMPDSDSERISIIAGGDSRNYREARCNANMLVGKLRPHCVMFGGDMTGSDKAKEWKFWFDDWQHTIGEDNRLTPIIVTRGNHEYSNQTLVNLFDVKNEHIYYALNLGGDLLRVYTLNSLIASGGNQKNWLLNDLADHQHMQWKIAQYHYAIRPHTRSKKERNNQYQNWAKLFHQQQVNMVVESDAHVVKTTWPIRPSLESGAAEGFIRDDLDGTVYIGEGCWGAPLRRNNDEKKWTRSSGSFNQFKWIFIDAENIEVRTVKTDNAKEVAFVNQEDVFTQPAGLKIWEPSTGAVLRITKQKRIELIAAKVDQLPVESKVENDAVQVTDVFGSIQNNTIYINWKTKDEIDDNVYFNVERMTDGGNFKTIAKVKGIGGKYGGANFYRIQDNIQDILIAEEFAYRIKKVRNGNYQYFEVNNIKEELGKWHPYQKITPNPTSGLLKVRYALQQKANVNIRLLKLNNKEVSQSQYINQKSGNYQKSIDMNHIPEGLYLLTIEIDEKIKHQYHVLKKV